MKLITFLLLFSIILLAQNIEKICTNLKFPEGPAWNGTYLCFSNCYGGWIAKYSDNKLDTLISNYKTKGQIVKTNGLTFYKKDLYICEYNYGKILKYSKNKLENYCSGYNGEKFNRPNDLAFSKKGVLYFTDPKSYGQKLSEGRIYFVDKKTHRASIAADSLDFPNGIAFNAKGDKVYVCESGKQQISVFDINKNGTLNKRKTFVKLPGGDPDGIAFDVKGNLYVGHFGNSSIVVVSPKGEIIKKIVLPGKKTSNVEFGGTDMRTLFITEDETNSVYKMINDIPGLKLNGH